MGRGGCGGGIRQVCITRRTSRCNICLDYTLGQVLSISLPLVLVTASVVAYAAFGVHELARGLGDLSALSFGITLFPATRCCSLFRLTGVSFERALLYHRVVARLAVALLLAHCVLQVLELGQDTLALDDGHVRPVFGLAAAITVTIMATLALEPVRRRLFRLFYVSHLVLLLPFFGFSALHSVSTLLFAAPGLALWVIDVAIRWRHHFRPVTVLKSDSHEGFTKLTIRGSGLEGMPGAYVYLSCPDISSWEAHPFSVALSVGTRYRDPLCSSAEESEVTLVVKSNGSFSKKLVKAALRAKTAGELTVRLSGPYGSPSVDLREVQAKIWLVGGGVGVTPILNMAMHILNNPDQYPNKPLVEFVWTARHEHGWSRWFPDEIKAMRANPHFTVRLYCTLKTPDKDEDGFVTTSPLRAGRSDAIDAEVTYRRPDFDTLFKDERGPRVCVCVCGPEPLRMGVVRRAAHRGFRVHSETFEL